MKRTETVAVLLLLCTPVALPAQDPDPQPQEKSQTVSLEALLNDMRAAEKAAQSVYLEMRTEGSYPGGMKFATKGTLRVLKTEHLLVHTEMEFSFADGLKGRMETVKNADGVWTLEDDPTFGEVYLHMEPELVEDLQWASSVLGQGSMVPAAVDERAASPLGSALVEEMARQFDLKVHGKAIINDEEGWVVKGDLRADLEPEGDPELPLPDSVDLFIRVRDSAVLKMVHLKSGNPITEIEITHLEVNRKMEPESFKLEVPGKRPRDVSEHPPAWAQVKRILEDAEAAAAKDPEKHGVLPSKKK